MVQILQRESIFCNKISSWGSLFIEKLVPGGTNFWGSIFTMTGTLHLYELPREVQKLIGGSGGILPPKFRNFTASEVGSEAIYCSEV